MKNCYYVMIQKSEKGKFKPSVASIPISGNLIIALKKFHNVVSLLPFSSRKDAYKYCDFYIQQYFNLGIMDDEDVDFHDLGNGMIMVDNAVFQYGIDPYSWIEN